MTPANPKFQINQKLWIGMGNACKPMAVSFQCMTKSTTIKKKKTAESNIFTESPHSRALERRL